MPGLLRERRMPMFNEESIKKLDPIYFNIIMADDTDVTIQSRNTGHYWYLHCAGYPTEESCVIFHKPLSSARKSKDIEAGGEGDTEA